jgi:Tfp pilus assembly protein PilZ
VRAYRDFIKDISLGGVFIFTRIPFKIGQQIRLVFRKKDGDNPVTIQGKIARVTPEGIGVEFFHPDVDKIRAIVSSASEG